MSVVADVSTSAPRASMAASLRIATFGLSSVDNALIDAVLKITAGRTRSAWTKSDVTAAHAVIINEAELRAAEESGLLDGRTRILLRRGAPTATRADTTILMPPVTVLNMLSALDFASDRAVNVLAHTAAPLSALQLTMADAVAAMANRADGSVVIQSDSDGAVLIDFSTRRYRADLIRSPLAQVLGSERFTVTPSEAMLSVAESRPLNHLLWSAGLESRSTPALQKQSTLRLRRWPEFPRLPHLVEHVQLCGLMNGREMTIAELADESELAPTMITAFARACLLCGYAQIVPKSNVQLFSSAVAARFARGGLLDRLRKRLGL